MQDHVEAEPKEPAVWRKPLAAALRLEIVRRKDGLVAFPPFCGQPDMRQLDQGLPTSCQRHSRFRQLPGLTIQEMAQEAGITTRALRYYEQEELFRAPRTLGNVRIFTADLRQKVIRIAQLRRIGLSLSEIRRLPNNPVFANAELRSLLEGRLNQMEQERSNILAMLEGEAPQITASPGR